MKLSIVSININITEGLNHSSVIRATWQEKRKKKRKIRLLALSSACKTLRYRESATASINKYSGSLTIECRAAFDRVRELLYRWRSCERKAKAWKQRGNKKSCNNTISSGRDPRIESRGLRVSRTNGGEPWNSERAGTLPTHLPTFVYPTESLCFSARFPRRRPRSTAAGRRSRLADEKRQGQGELSEFSPDSLFRAAVGAPPNKVETAGRAPARRTEPSRAELSQAKLSSQCSRAAM